MWWKGLRKTTLAYTELITLNEEARKGAKAIRIPDKVKKTMGITMKVLGLHPLNPSI